MNIKRSLAFLMLACCVGTASEAQNDTTAPKEIAAFAKAPFEVESFAYGDLTGRKTKDAAMILAKNPEHAFGGAEARKVVIALRGADGKLKKVAEGDNAVPLGAGPSGGDPTVAIQRNSVILEQFGGSRQKGTDHYQYKNIGGKWRLIGFTKQWYDSLAESIPESKTDVNLLTNYAEASVSSGESGKTSKSASFYEIFVVEAPLAEIESAPFLVLNGKSNGFDPNDLSATIKSVHDDEKLLVRVDVKDNNVLPEDSVRLLDENGKLIKPVSSQRTATTGGYRQSLIYDYRNGALEMVGNDSNRIDNVFRRFTLEIQDKDASGQTKTLSNAVRASKTRKTGGMLFLQTKSMPTLETVDVIDGDVHPLVFEL